MPTDRPPAVVLLSGGLDSTTCLAVARGRGFAPHALTFDYGQRHAVEIDAARRIAQRMDVVRHVVTRFDLRVFGGSALTDDLPVPKDRSDEEIEDGIPITYVPARNTIFLSFALAWAEVLESADVFLGVNALDYSGYPDCRPAYLEAFQRMADLATKAGVEGRRRTTIHAPLLEFRKTEIIRLGLSLGVDYGLTRSCYDPTADGAACGACDSCRLRLRAFETCGVPDPAPYVGRRDGRAMTYSVKEMLYTLQGEGARTGRPAVFCRFAGCNLWSGGEEDRVDADCRFCDTDFVGTDGPGGGSFETAEALARAAGGLWPEGGGGAPYVVCTGGEPLLQLDETLVEAFHREGFEVGVETNGTRPAPPGIDWLCVSPKAGAPLVITAGDELKLVFPQEGLDPESLEDLDFRFLFLQPMDGPDLEANVAATVTACLERPRWRLSLQTHKSLGIP